MLLSPFVNAMLPDHFITAICMSYLLIICDKQKSKPNQQTPKSVRTTYKHKKRTNIWPTQQNC